MGAVAAAAIAGSGPDWLQIIHGHSWIEGKKVVTRGRRDSVARLEHTRSLPGMPYDSLRLTTPGGRDTSFTLDRLERVRFSTDIPTIYINTEDTIKEIPSKEYYLKAEISMSAGGGFDSVAPMKVDIKGRGNTTWNLPKKPYRLKFDKKQSLCGFKKAKSYALIANYIDASLMHNSVAFFIARGLGMPYTNHAEPVDVVFNGIYKGSYILTEKIGINSGSVDLDDNEGLLLELDENMDEAFCFRSPEFNLPVMVKDPDLKELAEEDSTLTAQQRLDTIRTDFLKAEQALARGEAGAWQEYFDMKSLADYLIVYNVMGNWDFNFPRSLYLHRPTRQDKYYFGPVWDFDWAADYMAYYEPGIVEWDIIDFRDGGYFIYRMASTPEFMATYRERWDYFMNEVWPSTLRFMDEYADRIEVSAYRNGEIYSMDIHEPRPLQLASSESFRMNYEKFRTWLIQRVDYIDRHPNYAIY